jgi:hypothetical protein
VLHRTAIHRIQCRNNRRSRSSLTPVPPRARSLALRRRVEPYLRRLVRAGGQQ